MQALIQFYIQLAALSKAPQDGPSASSLTVVLMFIYAVLSIISALALYDMAKSILNCVLDIAVLILFTRLLVAAKKERTQQTLNAFLGVGIVIGVVSTLFSYMFITNHDPETITDLESMAFFIVFIWVVLSYGHIIRHATDSSWSIGIAISFTYVIVNTIILMTMSKMLLAS